MAVLGGERGFEQHALERGIRGRMDAGLAVRERALGPRAKADRPVGDGLAGAAFDDRRRQIADAISRPGASTASRWQRFSSWRTLPGQA